MRLLRETCAQQSCSMLFVTHDLGLAEQIADRIVVMKDGLIVEEGQTARIFACPQHAYTKKLLGYAAYGKGTSHFPSADSPRAFRSIGIRANRYLPM